MNVLYVKRGLPWCLSDQESDCQARGAGLIPGWGRCPGEGNDNPLQYSCLENPMDRGAWRALVCVCAQSLSLVGFSAAPYTAAARPLCPWDSPGRSTEAGCRFRLLSMGLQKSRTGLRD